MKYKYTIGADPELFLVDNKGRFKSGHKVIPGTKEEPFMVENGAIQLDGVAAEFNIAPASSAEQFSKNIRSVLGQMKAIIESQTKELFLNVSPVATFDKSYFRVLPKSVKVLGCEPDYDAYTSDFTKSPETKEPFRTGGGHIHVGWCDGANVQEHAHMFDCTALTKQLDAVLYPMSLLWDTDHKRRSLYGRAGTFRPKPYGMEYRPLSNAWVADPDLHVWVFNATKRAAQMMDDDEVIGSDAKPFGMVWDCRMAEDTGNRIKKTRLLEYHDYLVDEYEIPPLPESYRTLAN